MPPLLELRGVSKRFGGLSVIAGLDLSVDEGEIVSVIGPNGAGKTTLFNLVTGVYRPDEGDVRFAGDREPALPEQHGAREGRLLFQRLERHGRRERLHR
ncbi:MAG TPA: ATP-binding cassette domain-containing protein, partial [Gaiellaceae bacterium]